MTNAISIEGLLIGKIDELKLDLRKEIQDKHDVSMEFKKDFKIETEEWRNTASKENTRIILLIEKQQEQLQMQQMALALIKKDVEDLKSKDEIIEKELELIKSSYQEINDKLKALSSVSLGKLGKALWVVLCGLAGVITNLISKYW